MALTENEQQIISLAEAILEAEIKNTGYKGNSPDLCKKWLRMKNARIEHEVFGMVLLDGQCMIIDYVELFKGTISECTVHTREVVKKALELNAAYVVLTHNHPSGKPDPSHSDFAITSRIQDALKLVDIEAVDHIIVASGGCYSFQEHGNMRV